MAQFFQPVSSSRRLLRLRRIVPVAALHAHKFNFASVFWNSLREAHESQTIAAEILATAAHEMVAGMTSTVALTSTGPPAKRQRWQSNGWYTHRADLQQTGGAGQGHSLALVLDLCLKLRLEPEVELLLTQIEEEAKQSDPMALHVIMIPFLVGLAKILKAHSISLTNLRYQRLFQHVISFIVGVYVAPKPEPPKDWSLPRAGCHCQDCAELNVFLQSPISQRLEFKATGQRRNHREGCVRNQPSVESSTRRNPSAPHTLVLVKTRVGYEQILKAWEIRCQEARKAFDHIGHDALRQLLAERYTGLTEFGMIHHPRDVLAETQAPAPMLPKTQKPAIEIIDLQD